MAEAEHQAERAKLIEDWARITAERLQKSIDKKKIGISGSLRYSVFYALKAIAAGDVGSVEHSFNFYGRFVDMGVGRGQKIESVKGNADLIAMHGHGRRPKKWYSRTYFAEVEALSEMLRDKYGEETTRNIIESFQPLIQLAA